LAKRLDSSPQVNTIRVAWVEIVTGPLSFNGKFSIRLFANKPDANSETSIEDPHFLGQIRALDSGRGQTGKRNEGHVFSVMLGVRASKLKPILDGGTSLQLTFVPVGLEGASGILEIRNVEIKVIH
jgi:hypothetical protein